MEKPSAPAEQSSPAPQPSPLDGLRVLLAEDDYVSALAAARQMEKAGCRVEIAGDGGQALEALRKAAYDIVLMDVQMPVMDGVAAAKAIRNGEAGEKARAVPIIALTAHAMAGDREEFLAAGMDGYVSKPMEQEALMQELARVTGKAG